MDLDDVNVRNRVLRGYHFSWAWLFFELQGEQPRCLYDTFDLKEEQRGVLGNMAYTGMAIILRRQRSMFVFENPIRQQDFIENQDVYEICCSKRKKSRRVNARIFKNTYLLEAIVVQHMGAAA